MKFKSGKSIVCAGCALSLLLTACAGTETANSVDLRQVSLEVITEKAKEEGQIASVGMPDDWANWKGSWAAITERYGLAHEDTDMSSAEELSLFETEKDAATKDIGDVGQAFGPTAVEMDVVQPYKASTWNSIPDWAKDPEGRWTISYVGTMSCLVNQERVAEEITSWQSLGDSGAVVSIGDVVRGASSQMAVLSCAYTLGGGPDDLDPAFDFFKQLAQQDGEVQSGYCLVINKYAPHPYSAALAVEYLLSDQGQIDRAKGYARLIRSDVEFPADLEAKMIPNAEYADTIPLTDNETVSAACTEIATRWEEEIIPMMG